MLICNDLGEVNFRTCFANKKDNSQYSYVFMVPSLLFCNNEQPENQPWRKRNSASFSVSIDIKLLQKPSNIYSPITSSQKKKYCKQSSRYYH